MAIFEIYASDDADAVEFISDKKPILALVFPAIWLLWNKLWFAFGVYALIALFFAAMASTKYSMIVGLISFIPGIFVFLEGRNWLAQKHERNGFQLSGLMEADTQENAELRWFSQSNHPSNLPTILSPAATVKLPDSKNNTPLRSDKDNTEFSIFTSDQ